MNEKQIEKIMKSLDCTREEAIEIIKDDEAIDKGEKLFELTEEQKKAVKKATGTGTKKHTAVKRERKVDEAKKRLINDIRVLLEGLGANTEPLKNETDLHFTFEGDSYTVKLTKHRPPKN